MERISAKKARSIIRLFSSLGDPLLAKSVEGGGGGSCLGGQEPGGEDVLHQLSSLPFCHLTPCILKKEEEGLARVEKGSGIFPWEKRYCFSFGASEFGGVEKTTGLFLECKSTMPQLYSLSLS